MIDPVCPHCKALVDKIEVVDRPGWNTNITLVCCANCHRVLGTVPAPKK